jgi:alpha-galactosidase/6-phospho-beta-glucosidase family protein
MNNLIEEKLSKISPKLKSLLVKYYCAWQEFGQNSQFGLVNRDKKEKAEKDIFKLFKTSLNEVVEATKKENEEKFDKYRTGLLEELEEFGYNKDAIKKREKEILEGIEKMKKPQPKDIEQKIWGGEHGFPDTTIKSPDYFTIQFVKKIINK